jgi:hypothetical protein
MVDALPRRGFKQRLGFVLPVLVLALVCGGFGYQLGAAAGPAVPARDANRADSDMPSPTIRPRGTAYPAGAAAPSSPLAGSPAAIPSGCQPNLAFIADVTIPDDAQMAPGVAFQKTWAVTNAGNCVWAPPLVLKFTAGEKMNAPDSVAVPPAKPGESCQVSVPMKAPLVPGTYRGEWRLCAGTECYGSSIYVQIVAKGTATSMAPRPAPSATPRSAPTGAETAPAPGQPASPPGQSQVVVRSIFYDGQVYRVESDEYAELVNIGSGPQSLQGWKLNAGDAGQDFVFPAAVLQPGQSCRVYTNEVHVESGGFSFGSGKALWNNKDKDCGILYDAHGKEVSRFCY